MFGNAGMFILYVKVGYMSVVLYQQLPHDNTLNSKTEEVSFLKLKLTKGTLVR